MAALALAMVLPDDVSPAPVLVNRWAAEMAAIQKESSDEYYCDWNRVTSSGDRRLHFCTPDNPVARHAAESADAADSERGSWWHVPGGPSGARRGSLL